MRGDILPSVNKGPCVPLFTEGKPYKTREMYRMDIDCC